MAENPPITDDGIPFRVQEEMFVLERKNMEIEVKLDNCKSWGKRSATGKLFLTTSRIVFVNDKHRNSDFKSFDIPLFNIYKEKFEQPLFGSYYLEVKVKPLYGLIPDIANVKLWFKSGGCVQFLRVFDVILKEVRLVGNRNLIQGIKNQNEAFSNNTQNSNLSHLTNGMEQPQHMNNVSDSIYSQQPLIEQGIQMEYNNQQNN